MEGLGAHRELPSPCPLHLLLQRGPPRRPACPVPGRSRSALATLGSLHWGRVRAAAGRLGPAVPASAGQLVTGTELDPSLLGPRAWKFHSTYRKTSFQLPSKAPMNGLKVHLPVLNQKLLNSSVACPHWTRCRVCLLEGQISSFKGHRARHLSSSVGAPQIYPPPEALQPDLG